MTLAQGLKSIHFGSPNEYAFEYLMSGGENSLHVVLGLKKPDPNGELSLRPKPYAGKFLMSGAAAGCVVLFDPFRKLDEAQHRLLEAERTLDDATAKLAQSENAGKPTRTGFHHFDTVKDLLS